MSEVLRIRDGIKVLSPYILKRKRNFLLFSIGWFCDSLLGVVTPILFAIMIDEMVYYRNVGAFLRISLTVVAVSVFSCLLYLFIYAQHHYLMSMYTFDIRRDLFRKMQSMKAAYLAHAKTGDMIQILLKDAESCMHFVIRNVIHPANGILRGSCLLVYIYIISVPAGIAATLGLPAAVCSTFFFSKRMRRETDAQREQYGSYVSWLFEMLKGLTEIRLLCAESILRRDFTGHQRRLLRLNVRTSLLQTASDQILELINLLVLLAIYGVCAFQAYKGNMTIGGVIVLVSYITTLKETITYWLRGYLDAQSRLTSIARIRRFMAEEDEGSWTGKEPLQVSGGHVEIREIVFSYQPDAAILNKLSLDIPPGSHVAVVGKSGCGKTTLSSLLIGLYEPAAGHIFIDGQLLSRCSLSSIRQSIGIVQQEVLLFDGTVRDNLLLGNPRGTEENMWSALARAGIASFIEELPGKLEARIGKGGLDLSGGQKQRLAIARIYLKNPAILIFDEATSALDQETEALILEAWRDLLAGRTAIVITHRLSSVLLCNSAVLLENGRIAAAGKPGELLERNARFRELFAVEEVQELA